MSRANEPAFPREVQKYFAGRDDLNYTEHDSGLTIREEFAKAAMQGLLAAQIHGFNDVPANGPFASIAVGMADALIAELAKPVTP